jgi:hypothetical protein
MAPLPSPITPPGTAPAAIDGIPLLAWTGTGAAPGIGLGVVLVILGGILVLATRRRRVT